MNGLFSTLGLIGLLFFATLSLPIAMAIQMMRLPKGRDLTDTLLPRLAPPVHGVVERRRMRIERTALRKPFGLVGVGLALSRRPCISVACSAERLSDAALSFQLARAASMILRRKPAVFVSVAAVGFLIMNVSAQYASSQALGAGATGLVRCCVIAMVEALIVAALLVVLDVGYDIGADRFAARLVGSDVAISVMNAMIDDLKDRFPPRFALFWVPIELRRDSLRRWIARHPAPEVGRG